MTLSRYSASRVYRLTSCAETSRPGSPRREAEDRLRLIAGVDEQRHRLPIRADPAVRAVETGRADHPAEAQFARFRFGQRPDRHRRRDGDRQRQRDRVGQFGQVVQGVRPAQLERPDSGPPQPDQVTAHAQSITEVTGQSANVRSGRAVDLDLQVEAAAFRAGRTEQFEPGHGHRTGLKLDFLTGADPIVGPPTVHLDGRDRGRALLDLSGQRGHSSLDAREFHDGAVGAEENLPLGIIGAGGLAEPDRGRVAFVGEDEVIEQLGGPLHADDQHARRHRVERAGVADPTGSGQPTNPADHVVRRHAGRLVDDDQAAWPGRRFARHGGQASVRLDSVQR